MCDGLLVHPEQLRYALVPQATIMEAPNLGHSFGV
jgi:hypothetical protein